MPEANRQPAKPAQKRPRGRPRSQFHESSAGTLQSLDRALGALKALAESGGAPLSDLARALDLPTATLHRILTTLQAHGFATLDEASQQWRIGIEAYRTGVAFLSRSSLLEIGQPFLHQLMRETGETANLAMADGTEVVFVGQVETQNPIRAFFAAGTRTSMHASGTGKAILAAMPAALRDKTLRAMNLTRFTPQTLDSRAALEADLAQTALRGWSFDQEERYAGMSCIGAAILDEKGVPVAGVSVSGPSVRFGPERRAALGAAIAGAARDMTRLSGGIGA